MSRVKSSTKNIIFGFIQQCITLLLTFITRTIFIKYLNIELLGVNSLFSNILTVLSIADLGFGTAILYSMYKPLAEKNEEKLSALMNYFKKVYLCVATIIFICGILLLPFLNIFIKENNIKHIEIYYIMFLLDSVISYLLAYKVNIINADQKNYIVKKYTLFFNIMKSIIQCIVIVIFKNFTVYLIIQILNTLCINLYGAYISKKMYPYLNSKTKLDKREKNNIINNVKSLIIYKIGGIILNNTDNILISILIGISAVGYYTNYITITNAVTNIVAIIFTTVTFSVGNLIATENKEKQLEIFYKIEFFGNILFSFVSICLYTLINDLVFCWLGEQYIIDRGTVISIIINFYMVGVLNTIFIFRDTTGLFKKFKYVSIVTALLNIIFSVILGKIYGIFGIIISTALSRALTNFWYEPFMLQKIYFKVSSKKYFIDRLLNILFIIIICIITHNITKNIIVISWKELILKGIVVSILSISLLIIIYCKNENFKYYINLFKEIKNK